MGSTGMGLGELGPPTLRVPPPWGSPAPGQGELGRDWVNWDGMGSTGTTHPEGPTTLGSTRMGLNWDGMGSTGTGRAELGPPNLRIPPPWGSPGMGQGQLGWDWVNWDGPDSTGTIQPRDPTTLGSTGMGWGQLGAPNLSLTTLGEPWPGTGSTGMGLGELGWDGVYWEHPT